MSLKELETAVVRLPQDDFNHFADWFQRLISEKQSGDSLDEMLARVTDANLHAETDSGAEKGREQIVW